MITFGKSAHGKTILFTVGIYISGETLYGKWAEPVIAAPLPARLAWTEMNTGWDKKRGKK